MTQRYRNSEPSTSELRHDWLCDRWVIIAPQRTDRPDDFAPSCDPMNFARGHQDKCPFCRGHENETPPPLAVYPANGQLGHQPGHAAPWLVRVVPNKFPAVCGLHTLKLAGVAGVTGGDWSEALAESEPDQCAQAAQPKPGIDLFRARHVIGAHEVIIESPLHLCSLTELDRETATTIFQAYRDRLRHWGQCPDIVYAVIFKNVGLDAGASLVHTHSQLIATNVLPPDIRRAIVRMVLFYETEHS
jgi:UDPglucose--hexose-1-phosphate uridylyltransferase